MIRPCMHWWRACQAALLQASGERRYALEATVRGDERMRRYHIGIAESWERFIAEVADLAISEAGLTEDRM